MARPKRIPGSPETREEILRAARAEFAQNGLRAPLDAIAKRCGISRPSLLHHFRSKTILLNSVIDDIIDKARVRLQQAISNTGDDYAQTMQVVIKVLREIEQEEQGMASVLLQAALAEEVDGDVTQRTHAFIEVIYSTMHLAGATKKHPADEVKAVITHLFMGELVRLALAGKAALFWGRRDAVDPLFTSYFLG